MAAEAAASAEPKLKLSVHAPPVGPGTDDEGGDDLTPKEPEYVWFVQGEKDADHYEPFRASDAEALEKAETAGDVRTVLLDGGRHEVDLETRLMTPAYWDARPRKVIRALWFYKAKSGSWEPYSEQDAHLIEELYTSLRSFHQAPEQCELFLTDGIHKLVVREQSSAALMLNGLSDTTVLEFAQGPDTPSKTGTPPATMAGTVLVVSSPKESISPKSDPGRSSMPTSTVRLAFLQHRHDGSDGRRAVLRGYAGPMPVATPPQGLSDMPEEEARPVEHVVLVVHGIGEALFSRDCSSGATFRNSVRTLAQLALKQQQQKFPDEPGRIEFLPIEWYKAVHEANLDFVEALQSVTLPSLSRLREFNHDVVMDIMFYMSPYKRLIIETVTSAFNDVYDRFMARNPTFSGSVSVVGFSLGSVILFDMLSNQRAMKGGDAEGAAPAPPPMEQPPPPLPSSPTPEPAIPPARTAEQEARQPEDRPAVHDASAEAGEGRRIGAIPGFNWPQLNFEPDRCVTLGAPIGMFLAVRDEARLLLGCRFRFPTCPRYYNVFHPYDPIAYRIEPALDKRFADREPVLVPHHSGRLRMHVQLREYLDKSWTLPSVTSAVSWMSSGKRPAEGAASEDGNESGESRGSLSPTSQATQRRDSSASLSSLVIAETESSDAFKTRGAGRRKSASRRQVPLDLAINEGCRVDHVLQEAPLEASNEYLAALGSHAGYFTSEDVALFMCSKIHAAEEADTEVTST